MISNENKVYSFSEFYEKQIRLVFFVFILVAVIGNTIDLFTTKNIIINFNIITIAILLVTLFLYLKSKLKLKYSFAIVIYALVLNIFISMFFENTGNDEFVFYLLRNALFLIIILLFAGLFVNKDHVISIFLIQVFQLVYFTFKLKHPFLLENLALLILVYAALAYIIRFFIGKLHTSIIDIQQSKIELLGSNKKLKRKTDDLLTISDEIQAKTEELYEKNKLLLEQNTAKDKFFSIISHDLKNMVSTINGFIELLKDGYNNLGDDKRKYYIDIVAETGINIKELLMEILDWSRIQTNKLQSEPVVFEIYRLVNSVCFFLRQVVLKKNIILINRVDKELVVFADYNMIFTVLRNLVSNAIKFSYKNSRVTISSQKKDNNLLIKVSDTGTGMSESVMKGLFKIDKSHSTRGTENETGTGMGLILCKEFIEKNKGEIGVESEKGKGSTFWFTIPSGVKNEIKNN